MWEAVLDGARRSRPLRSLGHTDAYHRRMGARTRLTSRVLRPPYHLSKPLVHYQPMSNARVLGCRADRRSFCPVERRMDSWGGGDGRLDRSYTSGFGGSHHGVVRCEGLAKFRRCSDDGRNIGLGVSMFYLCVLAGALVTFLQPHRQIALSACVQVEPRRPSHRYGRLVGPCRVTAYRSARFLGPMRDRACDTAKAADPSHAYGGLRPWMGLRWQTLLSRGCHDVGRPQRAVALVRSLRGATFSGRPKIDIETVS
jgi:hypothetical protein